MHVIAINLPDLLLGLWRGTIDCDRNDSRDLWDWVVLTGDTWKVHGLGVARCRPYFPGSFDCTPRNPAEKISSGYKAWEFLLYVFGLCPGLLYGLLPRLYWANFCKLAAGVRLLQQRAVSVTQVQTAHRLLLDFTEEYEAIYYQQKVERLQFCRQSIHALSHLSPDTIRLGPGGYSSQWTLERTIGNLGEELKQPSNPYANLANRGLRRSQVSALHAMLPDLEPDIPCLPRGSVDLGGGYILLRARDETRVLLRGKQADALHAFMALGSGQRGLPEDWEPRYIRWARLQLPNLQIARCAWKETERASAAESVRRSRNVKVKCAYALISVWSEPDPQLLRESSQAVYVCVYHGQDNLRVIEAKSITAVVAMVPMQPANGDRSDLFFLIDKPGLDSTMTSADVNGEASDE
ncbi:hypothetical protein EDB92DRAFT_1799512 [Lactarius akahatsu]|uniref:Uncharacterized protein n=1 Tax=Lactarius akahatsu TaxID=416441 RepID=A0AAD4Q793_9AGAM|nr:hypothetical protein EDB92DRAFT_1799512 [Lactarius akahatsu]